MRLVEVRRCTYRVLALCTEDGDCPTLRALHELWTEDPALFREVTAGIYEYIPFRGPEPGLAEYLRDDVWEFRFGRLPGSAFRILWFFGGSEREIVCTTAFVKKLGEAHPTTPGVEEAVVQRHEYLFWLRDGEKHEIVPLEVGGLWPR